MNLTKDTALTSYINQQKRTMTLRPMNQFYSDNIVILLTKVKLDSYRIMRWKLKHFH